MQTQVAQAQNNDIENLDSQRLPNRDEQQLEHEQNLKGRFGHAMKLIEQLRAQATEKDTKISALLAETNDLARDMPCDAQMIQNIEDKRALEDQVQQLDREKIQMAERNVNVRTINAGLRATNFALEEQVRQLKTEQGRLIEIINSDEHTAVEEERQRMRVEQENLTTIVETLGRNASALRTENTGLRKRITVLKADNAKLRTRINKISTIATLRARVLNSFKTNNYAQREEIETLTKVAQNFDHEQDGLLQQIDGLNDENRQLKAESNAVNEQYDHEQNGFFTQVDEVNYKNLQLKEQNCALQQKINDLSRQVEEFDEAQDAAHALNDQYDREQDRLIQQIDQLNNENSQLKERNGALFDDLSRQEDVDRSRDQAHTHNLQLRKENQTLREKIDDLSRQVEKFDQAQDADNRHIELMRTMQRIVKSNHEEELLEARKRQQVPQCSVGTQTPAAAQRNASTQTSAQTTISDALKQIESSKQQLTQEIQRNAVSEQRLRQEMMLVVSGLESNKSDLQGQVQKLELEAASTKTRIAASEKEWRAEIAELKQTTGSKETEKLEKERVDMYISWRAEVSELKKEIQDGLDTNDTLREQIGMYEDQFQDMIAERCGSMTPETALAVWTHAVSHQDGLPREQKENDNASEAETEGTLVGDSPTPDEEDRTDVPDDVSASVESDSYIPPGFDAEVEQRQYESSPMNDNCTAPDHFETDVPKFESERENAAEPNDNNNNSSNINDIKRFIGHMARLYLIEAVSYNDLIKGNISAENHQEREDLIVARLDSIESTPSQEHALEIWIKRKREIVALDLEIQFLDESVRVMGDRNGGEEVLEEVLAKLPNARKRHREDENVENWVDGVERVSGQQSKRRRIE